MASSNLNRCELELISSELRAWQCEAHIQPLSHTGLENDISVGLFPFDYIVFVTGYSPKFSLVIGSGKQ